MSEIYTNINMESHIGNCTLTKNAWLSAISGERMLEACNQSPSDLPENDSLEKHTSESSGVYCTAWVAMEL